MWSIEAAWGRTNWPTAWTVSENWVDHHPLWEYRPPNTWEVVI